MIDSFLDAVAAGLEQQEQAGKLKPRSFRQFRKDFPFLRSVIVEGICREGETVNIIAASKVGKSWLSADLGMSIATGRKWLGHFETRPGKVLLIDNELHPETLSKRLDDIQRERNYDLDTLDENFEILPMRGHVEALPRIAAQLEDLGRDYTAIILDAFYRFVPSGVSENDNQAMMSLYNTLDAVAQKLGCAFFVIHHASKGTQTGKSITDVGAGAGSMSRATDTHLVIREHQERGYAVMEAAVRSFAPIEPISIYYKHPVWSMSELDPQLATPQTQADKRQERNDAETKAKILEALGTAKLSASQLRTKTGFGESRIVRGLDLIKDKLQSRTVRRKRTGKRAEVFWIKESGDCTDGCTDDCTDKLRTFSDGK
ncbi:MAG: AAA family ATPase [Pirellulaceae bacterium]